MKKLLFTIMALSSFVWAEVEENNEEGFYVASERYYDLMEKGKYSELLDELIKLQKKGCNYIKSKDDGYLLDNTKKQVAVIVPLILMASLIDYKTTSPMINLESINKLLYFLKNNPNFLEKLYQAQSNLNYFQKYITLALKDNNNTINMVKIDKDKYKNIEQLNDNKKLEFFKKQDKELERGFEAYYTSLTKISIEMRELANKIFDGVGKL